MKSAPFALASLLLALPAAAATPQGGGSGCPVEMVIVMDTSGSMSDEISALCTNLSMIVATLQQQNINVSAEFLGITAIRDCLTDDVANLLGNTIPGNLTCCSTLFQSESWGPATAIVADRYPWSSNSIRLIVPISDEGPWLGGSSCDANDQVNIDNAIVFANANQVVVAPIAGTGSPQCVIDLGTQLAGATGGQSFVSTDPQFDLAGFIIGLTAGTCAGTGTISVSCVGTSCPCGNDDPTGTAGCQNSTGLGGRMDWTGGTSVANNDFSLQLTDLPTGEFSMVVAGSGSATCSPLGDGLLGVQPGLPAAFMHFPVQSTGAQGAYSTGPGVAQQLAGLAGQMPLDLIGTTWRFQGVYRDQDLSQSPCGTGFNLTNVIEVQFSN